MSASEQIWGQFHSNLERYILSQVKDRYTAQDLMQEVFLKVQGKLPQLREESKVAPWLFRIAKNTVLDHYRQRSKKPVDNAPEQLAEDQRKGYYGGICLLYPPLHR